MKSIIVAMTYNGGIGKDGKLPWHLPADLKRFKELTKNSVCIMGYNTYREIADRFNYETTGKFLPFRLSVVVSSRNIPQSGEASDMIPQKGIVLSAKSIDEALKLVSERTEDIFFLGGESIFKEAMDIVDTIYFTMIYDGSDLNPRNDKFNCDRFFPINHHRLTPEYIESESLEPWIDHEDQFMYSFKTVKLKETNENR